MKRALGLIVGVVALVVAGCSSSEQPPPNNAPPPQVPVVNPPSSSNSSVNSKPLAKDCATVLPATEVDRVLARPFAAQGLRTVVGVAEPKIGRTARLGCFYGPATGQPPVTQLELSVSTYADEGAASKRVRATIETERGKGATPNDAQVGSDKGVLLAGPQQRMLVVSAGRTTVALSMANGLVPDDKVGAALSDLAGKALAAAPR